MEPGVSEAVKTARKVDAKTTPQDLPRKEIGATDVVLDSRVEKELRENGFRSTRRTKLICTIGPKTASTEMIEMLADKGMNVARLNMCHGSHAWHGDVIRRIREINSRRGFNVGIMVDTEGAEVHTRERSSPDPIEVEEGQDFIFTVRKLTRDVDNCLCVNYDGFTEDVEVGDQIFVDGGMVSFAVVDKAGPDVLCRCVDPGLILSRANLTFRRDDRLIRGRNSDLPVLTAKDWKDIDFAISEGVEWIALSFVKSADVLKNLRSYIAARSDRDISLVAKIESVDALPNLPEIIAASDAVMVARGDLGAQVPIEDVPSVQKEIVMRCREAGKPVIVASQLLSSMIQFPTPTRAEVADIADVVRSRADALMVSGETAVGKHADKAMDVLRTTAADVEEWVRREKYGILQLSRLGSSVDGMVSDELCAAAANIANQLGAAAIFCYTNRGNMAGFLSRQRPDCPIFAFTPDATVAKKMNLRWGVIPFRIDFHEDPESNVERTFRLLTARNLVKPGELVVVLSDLMVSKDSKVGTVRSVQVRRVSSGVEGFLTTKDGHEEGLLKAT